MTHSGKYETWFCITLSHEYYENGICPISLIPSTESKNFFRRSNILFLQQRDNSWILLKEKNVQSTELYDDDFQKMHFHLQHSKTAIYYNSDGIYENDSFSATNTSYANTWKTIELDTGNIIKNDLAEINIKIATVYKNYEFILIPKHHKNLQIKLVEIRNKIQFEVLEQLLLPNIGDVYRFLSKEKIKLTDSNNLKIQLWEIKETGERLLCNTIPIPQPEQISLIDPKNALSTYFYF